ncbi:MAG: glycosyltransferase family 4 protein [Deltaproteobacteria bacterium]|jgi:glycosyltransferase involved in cell wall biosynthesis|nr:glycosyltransferase family 4 protein [Deltaproteobacteria bacterium]
MTEPKIWASLHPFFEQGAILGRIEANRGFIRALLKMDAFAAYHFFLPHPDDCAFLEAELRRGFPDLLAEGRFAVRLRRDLPQALNTENYYCMHLSDPFTCYTDIMCLRNAFSRRVFPLTAPTHSLSYAEYGQYFLQHIWGGTTRRDALVATSQAGLRVARKYYDLLRRNYRLDPDLFFSPALRHIPLGVDPEHFPAPEEKAALEASCRRQYGLEGTLVFLIFARISYQSKMDLLPVLRAFKRAEAYGLKPRSYCLLLAGWVEEGSDSFGDSLKELAANLGIRCLLAARPDEAARKALYAAADVFLSPVDNLQETFGLTLLEAGVSSLPVIASDFDGYRDLVLDGGTGFLVPTTGPSSTSGTDALRAVPPASEYHLLLAQQCAVEVEAMARAIHRLALDGDLRRSMGAAGRERVLASFTWKHIVGRYLDLWAELGAEPCPLPETPAERPASALFHPAGPCYMEIFDAYFTSRIDDLAREGRKLRWSRSGEAVYRGKDFPVVYRLIEDRAKLERLKRILFMARKPVSVADLQRTMLDTPPEDIPRDRDFLLLWALKHDFLEFAGEDADC